MRRGLPVLLTLLAACKGDANPTDTEAGSSSSAASSGGGAPTTGDTTGEPAPALKGVADLHLHMFAEEAFGGGWFHGSHTGPGSVALAPCDGGSPGDHGRLQDNLAPLLGSCEGVDLKELGAKVPLIAIIAAEGGGQVISEFVSNIPGSLGDTGQHLDRTAGWPELGGWPRWDAIAHQQVWETQLHDAYLAGLRVEVISAVSLDWLCRALPPENLERPQCDEMDDVRLQLQQAHDFVARHDWAEIATTPADARRIVEEDRLAIILSVEASHLMGKGDWRAQLDELHALGVRTLQPVHQLNNRFGGAAPHNAIFQIAQFAENCHIDEDCGLTTAALTLGFDVDADCKNTLGLTAEGSALVTEMMDRGMLIDIAHLSERGVHDVHALSVAREHYPLYISHGHFREIMTKDRQREEKTSPAWVIQILRETGGMIGLRTGHEELNTYAPSAVDNVCHGSSRSFAQAYDFGRLGLKVAMGLGSDLNGFIQQTRPRFGPDACSASFPVEAQCQARDERLAGAPPLGNDFDQRGLAHIGLLTELLADLDQLGSDTTSLRSSADDFVRMWERAAGPRSGPVALSDKLELAGVTVLPAHGLREAEFPSECNLRYCPAALAAGATCRFDAECVGGSCVGAGECGKPPGVCAGP